MLFLITCFTTYAAGTYHWDATLLGMRGDQWDPKYTLQVLTTFWRDGLIYMGCVMAVLLAHEMGHFLMTVRYRVPSSYPIFIPLPMMFTGTMGAVIGMQGSRANRREMFDIGLAGPLAGLALTIPLVILGIRMGKYEVPTAHAQMFGDPLLAKLLIKWLRPDLPAGAELYVNPVYMAGWVGMFVTGLNMMPVSQLDGGHVLYALFLRRAHWIARIFLLGVMAFIIVSGQFGWTLMAMIVTLIGVDHPPTADDSVPLGTGRAVLGALSLVIPVLCFTPYPLYMG